MLIGSTAGKYGEAGHADYAVTKSGECLSISCCAYLTVGYPSSNDVWLDHVVEERDREDRAKRQSKHGRSGLGENSHGGERSGRP